MKTHVVRPTFQNILIRRIEAVKEINGILVPDQAQEKPSEGIIVAMGPDVVTASDLAEFRKHQPGARSQTFELGDHVVFGRYAGKKVCLDEGTKFEQVFDLVNQNEIDGVLTEVEVPDPVVEQVEAPAAEQVEK